MGACQGSISDRMSRLCHKKAPQTVVQYQNIIGMRTSFVSSDSRFQSKSSVSHPAQPSFKSKTKTRKALNDIYNRLDKLSQKFDSVGIKLNLQDNSQNSEQKDAVQELDDIVYRTHLLTQPKSAKQSAVVFHSQDVSNAVPVRFQKSSGTFVNKLNALQSTVVDRVKIKQMQNSQCVSLGGL